MNKKVKDDVESGGSRRRLPKLTNHPIATELDTHAAHLEAQAVHLVRAAAALRATSANLTAYVAGQMPGSVAFGKKAPLRAKVKGLVLSIAAEPIGLPLPPTTSDATPINGGLRVGTVDQIWPLALMCMKEEPFSSDGLWLDRLYLLAKGTTLGGFVQSILGCYSNPRPAGD